MNRRLSASVVFSIRSYGPAYQLQKAIVNPLGTDSLFVTDYADGIGTAERSRQLMRIIGELQIGGKLFIGAILNYHG